VYKGAGFAIMQSLIRSTLTIPMYGLFTRFQTGSESHYDRFMQRVGAAMVSGTLISVITYPIDTLKRIA
jgi:hypothetical protein